MSATGPRKLPTCDGITHPNHDASPVAVRCILHSQDLCVVRWIMVSDLPSATSRLKFTANRGLFGLPSLWQCMYCPTAIYSAYVQDFANRSVLTLESCWHGAKIIARWDLPAASLDDVQDGDILAWLAGHFEVLRPRGAPNLDRPQHYEMIHTLGHVLRLSSCVESDRSLPEGGRRLHEFAPRPHSHDVPYGEDRDVPFRLAPLSYEGRLRVIALDADLQLHSTPPGCQPIPLLTHMAMSR